MDISNYLIYLLIAVGYIASPGPAVFIAINSGASIGVRKTSFILLGNTIGLGIIALLSALGLGVLILSSALLTAITKVIGACWLTYLGAKMMLTSSKFSSANMSGLVNDGQSNFRRFYDGLMLALTNPKALVFFVSIYPQFVVGGDQKNLQLLLLGGTFLILSFVILNAYSLVSTMTVGKILNEQRTRIFSMFFGAIFIFLGALLLVPVFMHI